MEENVEVGNKRELQYVCPLSTKSPMKPRPRVTVTY